MRSRRKEAKKLHAKGTRWATLKAAESKLTEKQIDGLGRVGGYGALKPKRPGGIKELLRWVP